MRGVTDMVQMSSVQIFLASYLSQLPILWNDSSSKCKDLIGLHITSEQCDIGPDVLAKTFAFFCPGLNQINTQKTLLCKNEKFQFVKIWTCLQCLCFFSQRKSCIHQKEVSAAGLCIVLVVGIDLVVMHFKWQKNEFLLRVILYIKICFMLHTFVGLRYFVCASHSNFYEQMPLNKTFTFPQNSHLNEALVELYVKVSEMWGNLALRE